MITPAHSIHSFGYLCCFLSLLDKNYNVFYGLLVELFDDFELTLRLVQILQIQKFCFDSSFFVFSHEKVGQEKEMHCIWISELISFIENNWLLLSELTFFVSLHFAIHHRLFLSVGIPQKIDFLGSNQDATIKFNYCLL